jgi:superfamily II DNA or RNA helicase
MGTRVTLRPSRIIIDEYSPISYMEGQLRCRDQQPPWNLIMEAFDRDDDARRMIIPGGYEIAQIFKLADAEYSDQSRTGASAAREATFRMRTKPRGEEQLNALDFLAGKQDSPDIRQRFVCMATGKGKTFVALEHAQRKGVAFAVFVDQDELGRQWEDEIAKHTDIPPARVYRVAGAESVRALLSGKRDPAGYDVFIVSHRTMHAWAKLNADDWDCVGDFLAVLGIGIKFYDEAHVEWGNIVSVDLHSDVAETVYLTATPARSNAIEDRLYQRVFATVPKFGFKEKFEARGLYHTAVYLKFDSQPDIQTVAKLSASKRGFDVIGWSKYILQDSKIERLYGPVRSVLGGLLQAKPDARAAVVLKTNDLVDAFASMLRGDFPGKTVSVYNGVVKKSELKAALEADIICTTEKSFGKAIDVQGLEVLFMTVPVSSETIVEQMMGRLRGKEGNKAVYVHMTDVGFLACRKQFSSCRRIIEAKAKKTREMNFVGGEE